jgi:hypothetical protein
VLAEKQVVGVRPIDTTDLVDVAEAFGDEERGLGALALQNGVDGDGGTVQKQPRGFVGAVRLRHSRIDALDEALRCR